MSIRSSIRDYIDAPVHYDILGRAICNENRLGIILRKIGSAIYYVFTRGGLIAAGALVGITGYFIGFSTGTDSGFQDGCRVGLGPAAGFCDLARDVGDRIHQITIHPAARPGHPLTSEQEKAIVDVCYNNPLQSLPDGLLRHYGCPPQ